MNTFTQIPEWLLEIFKEIDYNFFLISDTHFYHTKIAEYCDRPDNWDDLIIKNWNNTVNSNDVVLHLGDFAFGNFDMAQEKRKLLNGQIILVKGNHDRHGVSWFNRVGIDVVKNPFILYNNGVRLLFSHVPQYPIDDDVINIHGHVHNTRSLHWKCRDMIYKNCSVEAINYTPIKFKRS